MSKLTLVSAAVLMRGERDFLLARRPEGKVYAGWWEFPGGKVEAGESFYDALLRELHEELGITITQATPWLTREFTYPHANVRIRFFRVTAWEGEIHPHEHDAIAWLKADEPPTVEPVLPANGPILKGLALPTTCALTNAEENGCASELSRLKRALDTGLRFIQIRDKLLPTTEREAFAREVVTIGKARKAIVVVNDDAALAQRIGADGIHLSSRSLAKQETRPDFAWVGASCHTAEELQQAAALALDYALLGPVQTTPTHPDVQPLGWQNFEKLAELSPLPVFALGGMRTEMMEESWSHGAHGVALMRGWG